MKVMEQDKHILKNDPAVISIRISMVLSSDFLKFISWQFLIFAALVAVAVGETAYPEAYPAAYPEANPVAYPEANPAAYPAAYEKSTYEYVSFCHFLPNLSYVK